MSYRYYSTQRPLWPGTFPRPTGNRAEAIENYDSRTYVPEIGREAWGHIDYEHPLTAQEAADYELAAGCAGCVNEAASRDMDCCWDCNRNPRRRRQDLYRPRQ